MPDCPNCGRSTLRTKDWVCQWCGYPLVSNSFKAIDKTFKELQDERKPAAKTPAPAAQPQPVIKYEPEPRTEQPVRPVAASQPAPAPEPQPNVEPQSVPVTPSQPESSVMITPEPQPNVEPQSMPVTPSQPESSVMITPEPQPNVEPQSVPVTPSQPESSVMITPELQPTVAIPPESVVIPPTQPSPAAQPPPQNAVTPEPAPLITPPPAQKPQLPSESKPEFFIKPEPLPELLIELEDIEDGMEIAAEQIDALFKTEQEAANSAFTDKTFIIQGIVEKIFIREHLDIRYILLTGIMQGMTWSLRCTFERENGKALSGLQEGQAVKVQGTYDGYGKNIIFKDCVLV